MPYASAPTDSLLDHVQGKKNDQNHDHEQNTTADVHVDLPPYQL